MFLGVQSRVSQSVTVDKQGNCCKPAVKSLLSCVCKGLIAGFSSQSKNEVAGRAGLNKATQMGNNVGAAQCKTFHSGRVSNVWKRGLDGSPSLRSLAHCRQRK